MTAKEFQSWCKMAVSLIDLKQTDELREILLAEIDDEQYKKLHPSKNQKQPS